MHFSIPETEERSDSNGSSYTVYKLHINGVYHCSVRYRQLHDFQLQLRKEFGAAVIPSFPPKKLFPLTPSQLDERRVELEKFVQQISQMQQIANCSTFNGFLLAAQQESQNEVCEDVKMDVFLANGFKIAVNIKSTDQTEDVLEAVASKIDLQDQFVYYFGLYLVCKESTSDFSIIRKLQDFESPFISLKSANVATTNAGSHWIMLRKAYWDTAMDDDLMEDRVAMNLIYVQAVSDVERNWVHCTEEQASHLSALQQRGSKKEYLRFVRTLKFYGYVIFIRCSTDYPQPNTTVDVAAGNKELSLRFHLLNEEKELGFKVTRMRCWRISSMVADASTADRSDVTNCRLELAFEYLVAKNTLKWVTLYSSQAILISMCLQGMVDELIMKKDGRKMKRPQDRNRSPRSVSVNDPGLQAPQSASPAATATVRNGTSTSSSIPQQAATAAVTSNSSSVRWRAEKVINPATNGRASQRLSTGATAVNGKLTENDAFAGIDDDDL